MIVESNHAAASMICKGLEMRVQELRSEIEEGPDAIVNALERFGPLIAGELAEIRWELIQLRANSEQILEVLKRPRSAEAQELLRQGVRNLENDKLEEAVDRFQLALRLDNTDYQVLMNLSAVELRKNNAEGAISFVKDALILPQDLDVKARADALWHLARIYYAAERYDEALSVGRESVSLANEPRRILQAGIYAMLAGDRSGGLSLIMDAVRSDPCLFDLAIAMPDLFQYSDQVVPMFGDLLTRSLDQFRDSLSECLSETIEVDRLDSIDPKLRAQYKHIVGECAQFASEPSYLECCRALLKLAGLRNVTTAFKLLNQCEISLRASSLSEAVAVSELRLAEKRSFGLWRLARASAVMSGFAAYFLIGFSFQIVSSLVKIDLGSFPELVIAWIVVLGLIAWFSSSILVGRIVFTRLKKIEGDVESARLDCEQKRGLLEAYRSERTGCIRRVVELLESVHLS